MGGCGCGRLSVVANSVETPKTFVLLPFVLLKPTAAATTDIARASHLNGVSPGLAQRHSARRPGRSRKITFDTHFSLPMAMTVLVSYRLSECMRPILLMEKTNARTFLQCKRRLYWQASNCPEWTTKTMDAGMTETDPVPVRGARVGNLPCENCRTCPFTETVED